MTNDLFRDLLDGRTELPSWRANFLMGITGPNRVAILPTTDPWLRALWAKEQQGHGPAVTPLRVRGRTTHYKEKG